VISYCAVLCAQLPYHCNVYIWEWKADMNGITEVSG